MMNRTQLRHSLKRKRQQLSADNQHSAAIQLAQHVAANVFFQQAKTIASYMAYGGEMNVLPLSQLALQQNKKCYLPVVQNDQTLNFVDYTQDSKLVANQYKILEPVFSEKNILAVEKLDLVLVPLIAFDDNGNRLGTGAGFYDRTFAFLKNVSRPTKPFLLGIGYAWQQVENIAAENWDIKLDAIATDKGIIVCNIG